MHFGAFEFFWRDGLTGLVGEADAQQGDVGGSGHDENVVDMSVENARLWPRQRHLQNRVRQTVEVRQVATAIIPPFTFCYYLLRFCYAFLIRPT